MGKKKKNKTFLASLKLGVLKGKKKTKGMLAGKAAAFNSYIFQFNPKTMTCKKKAPRAE